MIKRICFFFLLSSVLCALPTQAAESQQAMVATADPHATRAALDILERGGNAVDAAIAAQWVLNVVEPQGSGLGGGGFFVYYDAITKHVYSFDGREAAPAEAYPDMFLDEKGEPYPFYPDRITGGLSVGVPGVLKLLETVHERFSSRKFSFAELFKPAIYLASKGFPVTKRLSEHIAQEQERFKMFPASAQIFLDKHKNPLRENAILFQPDLAATFQLIQEKGPDVFYHGDLAREIVRAVRLASFHPGTMTFSDLENYKIYERALLRGSYRSYDVFSMGPPSSGGSTLIEALNILELYDMRSLGSTPQGFHVLGEAQQIAFEDRNHYLGDPAFSQIPIEKLMSKSYAKERAEEIRMDFSRDSLQATHRDPNLEGVHTTHISIVDARGNMAAFTTTIESVFGCGMVVPGRGFVLNNELTDFEVLPQSSEELRVNSEKLKYTTKPQQTLHSSLFTLHPNAPEGEKRPRSSMTPTLIFKQDKPFMIVGSPGGSTIIGTVLNIIVNVIDHEMSLKDAMRAPKLIHRGEMIEVEGQLFRQKMLMRKLKRLGHAVILKETFGNAQAILFDPNSATIHGESDPRGEGEARGY